MKAEELRIGNWVMTDTGSTYQIELSDFYDWYNDHNSHEYGNYVLPISLTEEWLLKFVFEKRDNRYYKDRYMIEQGLSQFFDNGMSFRITINNAQSVHANSIKYVHQLQNLYYALTGEEL